MAAKFPGVRRLLPLLLAVLALGVPSATAQTGPGTCTPRLLVLSAFPAELDALLPAAHIKTMVQRSDRAFYVGKLEGNNVVMALTGIGPLNATRTTKMAFDLFRCGPAPGITGVVFSGVSGGKTYIGDVTVASRWTLDGGKSWIKTDPTMFKVAASVARSVHLDRSDPQGDPACVGIPPALLRTISVDRQPRVVLGGNGGTTDPFGGKRMPCIPGGGDIFGCDPCLAPTRETPDPQAFASGMQPFFDPSWMAGYFASGGPPSEPSSYVANDEETAAAATVAHAHHVPFIGFRALSDGKGDPLMLPGFPVQFFVYKDLAAQNAGKLALAFLKAWAARSA